MEFAVERFPLCFRYVSHSRPVLDEDGPIFVLNSSSTHLGPVFVLVSSRPWNVLGQGWSQDDSSRPTDPWEGPTSRNVLVFLIQGSGSEEDFDNGYSNLNLRRTFLFQISDLV